jgi:hypothetical protein
MVNMFATWGEMQIVVGALLGYSELVTPEHTTAPLLIIFLSNLNGSLRKVFGHKNLTAKASLAPGRFRSDMMTILTAVACCLCFIRERYIQGAP